jgi:hypothetical protein
MFCLTTNGSLSSSVTEIDGTDEGGVGERGVTTVDCSVLFDFCARNICDLVGASC